MGDLNCFLPCFEKRLRHSQPMPAPQHWPCSQGLCSQMLLVRPPLTSLQRPPYMFMGVLDCFGTGTAKGSSYARVSAIHSLWIWVRQIFLFKGCQRFPGSRDMDGFALLTCQLAKSPICLWLFLEHSPPHNTGLARRCFVRRCFWCGTHWLLLFSVCLTWCSWAR